MVLGNGQPSLAAGEARILVPMYSPLSQDEFRRQQERSSRYEHIGVI